VSHTISTDECSEPTITGHCLQTAAFISSASRSRGAPASTPLPAIAVRPRPGVTQRPDFRSDKSYSVTSTTEAHRPLVVRVATDNSNFFPYAQSKSTSPASPEGVPNIRHPDPSYNPYPNVTDGVQQVSHLATIISLRELPRPHRTPCIETITNSKTKQTAVACAA